VEQATQALLTLGYSGLLTNPDNFLPRLIERGSLSSTLEIVMKKLLTVVLLCAAAASPVLAQSARTYYGALDFGTLNMSSSRPISSPNALTVSGGYRFMPNLAGEVGYTMVGDTSINVPGVGPVTVSQYILSAVAVGSLPIDRNFTLFGKLGLALHNGEINGIPDDVILGFGGQLMVTPKVSLRLQYESLGRAPIPSTTYKADMSRLSVGAIYNF
jgi:opacity protein-like surface antigen